MASKSTSPRRYKRSATRRAPSRRPPNTRRTFRPPQGSEAWQKQLRDSFAHEGGPAIDLTLKGAIVKPIRAKLAEQIILKYEWLGTMAATSLHYGIFFGSYCAGATCVGKAVTAGTHIHSPFKIEPSELLVLARGACVHWAPPGTNSKLVAWTTRLLPKSRPGAKLLLAYADTDAGEIGTIYQACNWNYVGLSGWVPQFVAPNGRIFDGRIISYYAQKGNVTWVQQRDAMVAKGWKEQRSNPKHRYVAILDRSDKNLVKRVESMSKPYPKRKELGLGPESGG
jgi:hypothetical protein